MGTGIAGLSAAEAVRASDPRAEITLVGREREPFYSRPGLAYLLAGSIPERQLQIRTKQDLRELAAELRTDQVTRVDPEAHEVTLAAGGSMPYDRVLLATGSAAVRPDLDGATLDGVHFLDDLEDARSLVSRAKRAKTAVVLGGGPTALELAEGLAARGLRVHYLLRGARTWAGVLDPVESRIVEDALEGRGVAIHRRTQVVRVLGASGRVEAVRTDADETIRCDLLAIAIGVRPRLDLARQVGVRIDRGIVVDERFETSVADVLAAGDVAQIPDPNAGGSRLDALWSSALAAGRAAGRALAGDTGHFAPTAGVNVTRLAGIPTTIIGAVGDPHGAAVDADLVSINRGDSEAWRTSADGWAFEERRAACRIRVVVGERHVLGAVVMGDVVASRALVRLVEQRIDVSAIRAAAGGDPTVAIARLVALGENGRA